MKSAKNIDMTAGSIMKSVLLFALPICIGNVLQQLYNTVDTLVIGNFCGSVSLAAVGTSAQPVEILLCIFLGLGTGVSILVSQYAGNGDLEQLKETVATATSFLYLCAIPIAVLGQFIGPAILRFMRVPADTWELSVTYLQIIFLGVLGNLGYNMNAGILRGVGDSAASLWFLLISCLVNIVLDLLFVAGFGMGVAGAAAATIIAMFCSWIFSIIYIRKQYPEMGFTVLPHHINKPILMRIIGIGLPIGLNNSIYSVGHILMQSLVNLQGSAYMAATAVATKLTGIANVAISSLSSAATTFSGQNLGARNYVRLRQGARQIPFYSGLITLTAGIVFTLFCEPLLRLFTSDPEVLDLAVLYTRIVLPPTFAFAVLNAINNFMNGLGEVRFPTVVNLLMLWAVRIPCAYLIASYIDGKLIMISMPVSFIFGMFGMSLFFFSKRWKEILQLAKKQEEGR